jgi:hypothetical protein
VVSDVEIWKCRKTTRSELARLSDATDALGAGGYDCVWLAVATG